MRPEENPSDNAPPAAESSESSPQTGGQIYVAGVGASAGGLEALERLFKSMPRKTGVAFVVIQHLSPDFKSLMDELLARHTDLTIRRVENDMPIEPDTIFLIPPRKEMIVSGGRLFLADKEPGHDLSLPIDHFFRSLAQDAGPRAIGIVLSGTGSDGSRGICDIHEAGGFVIAQSEETAKFDGMPRSARNTGIVDCVLSPEDIPKAIVDFVERPLAAVPCGANALDRSELVTGFDAIFRMLRDEYGIDFSYYKPSTVSRRIERRQSITRTSTLDEYVDLLQQNPDELNKLYHDLLIGVTRFFRDKEAFDRIEKEIVPELLSRAEGELRVWVAGCATGEEAYSLAILLRERLDLLRRPVTVKIFASDVHQASLDFAAAGIYQEDALTEVTPTRLKRSFIRQDDGYHIAADLRKMIVFAQHNIIKDAPFTRLDLITCRNLLIYLQPPVQKKVLSLFHFGLKTGGILFLGPSESPGELSSEFHAIDDHWKIYRKRRDVRLPPDLRISSSLPAVSRPSVSTLPPGFDASMSFAYDELLDEYMPSGLLVTERRQLAHVFGDASRFLKLRSGRPSGDVMDLVEGDLKLALAGALQRAARDDEPVIYTGIRASSREAEEQLKVTVKPLKSRHTHLKYLFVALETIGARPVVPDTTEVVDVDRTSREHVSALESELRHTRESLQAAVEELESSNEELQASNEELLASNEELQSTNEELHSVNEELYTVNAEYQKKIAELTELTDDMDNLLQSTEIGTIFLDDGLCIRKFTPQIARSFNLLPQDIGRRIEGFSHNIRYENLLDDLTTVVETGDRVEKEVQDRSGNWFFLRILPYISHSRLSGAVLSLIDISLLKHAEVRLAQLGAIITSSNDAIVGLDLDGRIQSWNPGAERLFGYSADEAVGQTNTVLHTETDQPAWPQDIFERLRRSELEYEQVETQQRRKDGAIIDVLLSFSPIRDPSGNARGVSLIAHDLTATKTAERALSERACLSDLRAAIGMSLARAHDTSAIMQSCADSFAQHLDVALACIWIVVPAEQELELRGSSGSLSACGPPPRLRIGETHIGRIAQHRERLITSDLRGELTSGDWAMKSSARYFAGFPLIVDEQVVGVLALYSDHSLAPNVVRELGSISFELAQCIDRKQAEADLREAEHAARDAVRRRDQFLAMLSHELRNPLAAVVNAASLLEFDNLDHPTITEACGAILRQSRQMSRLLDDLLEVSRIASGRIQIREEVCDLREITRAAIEAVQPLLTSSGSSFEFEVPEEAICVNGDPSRLQQIQVNLLANAAKYTPSGGSVRLSLTTEGRAAVIRVSDSGIGIPREMQERIFDLFVQGDSNDGEVKQGLGVGLTLVRALARLHNGDVTVHSDGAGKGSTFTVRLPVIPAAGKPCPTGNRELTLTGLRLLVVDDNADIRRMSSRLLEHAGCKVRSAVDGEQALEVLDEDVPDAALIDIGLPGISGYDVAQRIRLKYDGHSPFLIAITGFGQPEDRRKALAAGFDAHLVKPINMTQLGELLAPLRQNPRAAGRKPARA